MKVTGKIMKELVENGISQWPKFDGRWACLSGLKFKFDPASKGDRIVPDSFLTTDDKPILPEQYYTLASTWFIQTGGDGFVAFRDQSVIR